MWRWQETFGGSFLRFFFFLLLLLWWFILKRVNWKALTPERVLWKVSVFVTHVTDCPFYFCMKKKKTSPPGNLSVNYISSLLFTDETTSSVSWRFINTFTALKTLSGSIQTQLLCMLFLDTVPNNFFSRMYKNTSHPEFKSRKHSRLVKSGSQGIFISTIFVTSVTLYKVDIFLCVCSELATADS